MGSVVLGSLPDVLRNAGITVELWPGYETRSRSTGGFDALLGIGHHHDAIAASVPEVNRSRSGWDRESNPNRPVGNVRVQRDGTWVVGSLMATNTQGRGPSLTMSKGVIPANSANRYMFSIEPSNDGIGQPWPDVQCDSLLTGTAAICNAYGLAASDNLAHFETAPGRKSDPAGPSMFNDYLNAPWEMDRFRTALAARMVAMANTEGDEMTKDQADALGKQLDELLTLARRNDARVDYLANRWSKEILVNSRRGDARSDHTTNLQLPDVARKLAEIRADIDAIRADLAERGQ